MEEYSQSITPDNEYKSKGVPHNPSLRSSAHNNLQYKVAKINTENLYTVKNCTPVVAKINTENLYTVRNCTPVVKQAELTLKL